MHTYLATHLLSGAAGSIATFLFVDSVTVRQCVSVMPVIIIVIGSPAARAPCRAWYDMQHLHQVFGARKAVRKHSSCYQ